MHEMNKLVEVCTAAAIEAGEIQKRNFGRTNHAEFKGEIDLVTEVDRLCEVAIVRTIREAFPDHDILAEEASYPNEGSPYRWIIDPLDGTTNYFRGLPYFCVSIGVEVEGTMEVGVVYDPMRGELFQAERGKGAFLNGRKLFVSRISSLSRALLCTGFPYDVHEHVNLYIQYFREFLSRCLALRRFGSAAVDLCYLACGRFDGFWELKLQPWDVAAASLIVSEAGGTLSDLHGGAFSIYSREIVASNGRIHQQMIEAIEKAEMSGMADCHPLSG